MLPLRSSKPKPAKAKKKTPKTKSVCVECGEIWRGKEVVHDTDCLKALPVITFRKNKTDKQMYEAALDHICRIITEWRDGGVMCVIHDYNCGRISQWGHVVPQGANAYLVYELSNSFRQSDTCNLLHRSVQYPYLNWYKRTFGSLAADMLDDARKEHKNGRNAQELFDLLIRYVEMYFNRHSYHNMDEKVAAGYYGEIIKEAWVKEGRI
jgi:hypothetical protein